MAGAQLLGLQGPEQTVIGKGLLDTVTAVAIDHADLGGFQGRRRSQHMAQQGPARKGLQDLGQVRVHALALTGSENDDA